MEAEVTNKVNVSQQTVVPIYRKFGEHVSATPNWVITENGKELFDLGSTETALILLSNLTKFINRYTKASTKGLQ